MTEQFIEIIALKDITDILGMFCVFLPAIIIYYVLSSFDILDSTANIWNNTVIFCIATAIFALFYKWKIAKDITPSQKNNRFNLLFTITGAIKGILYIIVTYTIALTIAPP